MERAQPQVEATSGGVWSGWREHLKGQGLSLAIAVVVLLLGIGILQDDARFAQRCTLTSGEVVSYGQVRYYDQSKKTWDSYPGATVAYRRADGRQDTFGQRLDGSRVGARVTVCYDPAGTRAHVGGRWSQLSFAGIVMTVIGGLGLGAWATMLFPRGLLRRRRSAGNQQDPGPDDRERADRLARALATTSRDPGADLSQALDDLDQGVGSLLFDAAATCDAFQGQLWLPTRAADTRLVLVRDGLGEVDLRSAAARPAEQVWSAVVGQGRLLRLGPDTEEPGQRDFLTAAALPAAIAMPVYHGGVRIGMVVVGNPDPDPDDPPLGERSDDVADVAGRCRELDRATTRILDRLLAATG